MSGPSETNERLQRVVQGHPVGRPSVAGWTATAFLVAGVLLGITAVLQVLAALTPTVSQGMLTGVPGFAGVVFTYAGLLGLYPRVTDRTSRLGRAAVALVALPAAVILVLLVWGALGHSLASVPVPVDVVPAVGAVFISVFVLFALGTALFGLAGLQSRELPRAVGVLLMALAATWFLRLGVSAVYVGPSPVLIDAPVSGGMAAATMGIGYHLGNDSAPSSDTDRSADASG